MKLFEIAAGTNDIVFDTGTVWYHGSKVGGFWEFDSKYTGSGVVSLNTSGGFYFSSDREAAEYFADTEQHERGDFDAWDYDDIEIYGKEGEFYFLVGANPTVNRGPFHTEEDAMKAGRQVVDEYNAVSPGQIFYYDDKIVAVYLALGHALEVRSIDELRSLESSAREEGYDSIMARDIWDGDRNSDVAVVFDPTRIRII